MNLYGIIITGSDCKGIIYPYCFGIIFPNCKGIIGTGSDCFGWMIPD